MTAVSNLELQINVIRILSEVKRYSDVIKLSRGIAHDTLVHDNCLLLPHDHVLQASGDSMNGTAHATVRLGLRQKILTATDF